MTTNYANNDFNGLISCGSDARIRYWDLLNPHKSYLIVDNYFRSGNSNFINQTNTTSGNIPSNTPNLNRNTNVTYMGKFIEGMHLIQEFDHTAQSSIDQTTVNQSKADSNQSTVTNNYNCYNNWEPQDISPAHKNIITDIIWLEKSNLLVSGSKDGCVKLWK